MSLGRAVFAASRVGRGVGCPGDTSSCSPKRGEALGERREIRNSFPSRICGNRLCKENKTMQVSMRSLDGCSLYAVEVSLDP